MASETTPLPTPSSLPHAALGDLVQHATAGLLWLAADGEITWANPATDEILGRPRGGVVGRSLGDFVVEAGLFDRMLIAAAGPGMLHRPVDLVGADGRVRRALVSLAGHHARLPGVRFRAELIDVTEQHEAERTRHDESEWLEMAMRAGRTWPWRIDRRVGVLETHPLAGELLAGESGVAGIDGMELFSWMHEDDREAAQAWVDAAVATNHLSTFEFRVFLPDHTQRWVDARAAGIPARGGEVVTLRGMSTDITARRLAEQRKDAEHGVNRVLAEGRPVEETLNRVVQVMGEALDLERIEVWALDEDGRRIVRRRSWRSRFRAPDFDRVSSRLTFEPGAGPVGLVFETGVPLWVGDISSGVTCERAGAAIAAGLFGGAVFPLALPADERAVLSVFTRRALPRDPDLETTILVIANQVAAFLERARYLDRLRGSGSLLDVALDVGALTVHERERLLSEVNLMLSAQLDIDRLLRQVTDVATRLTGAQLGAFFYTVVDSDGQPRTVVITAGQDEVFAGAPMPRGMGVFAVTFDHQESLISADIQADPRYGQEQPHHGLPAWHPRVHSYLAVPVLTPERRTLGGLFFGHEQPGVFTDADREFVESIAAQSGVALENAHLFEEARRAVSLRDQFLSVAAHELRTPLTTVKGFSRLLAREVAAEAPRIEFLRDTASELDRQVSRFEALVSDLLDASRIRGGHLELTRGRCDLRAIAAEAVARVRYMPEVTEAHEVVLDAPAPVAGDWDADRIEQVLANVLGNAVKYSPDGGTVAVRVTCEGDEAVLSISDEGIGIDEADIGRIFEPFSRASRGLSIEGTGLGLHITSEIVRQHGGSIAIESALGAGTRVEVRLPRTWSDGGEGSDGTDGANAAGA